MSDRGVTIVGTMTSDGIWREEKGAESALLVIVGEWECSPNGCWKFVVETNKLAQCIMVFDDMTYATLKDCIEEEFDSESSGLVCSLSYCPPGEMSMFASGKTPPVSINTNSGLHTFNKIRATTRPLNLLVTFAQSWGRESSADEGNRVAERTPIINLADGTPSFLNTEGTEDSTYADIVTGKEQDKEHLPEASENLQEKTRIINLADGTPSFLNTEWTNDTSDGDIVTGKEQHSERLLEASKNLKSKIDNSGRIDLNNIYDSAMVTRLEEIEEMARAARGSTSRKGKENVTYPETQLGLDGQEQREWNHYGRGDA